MPTSWDSCTASVGSAEGVRHAVWSPCGQFIAATVGSVVDVRDSNTLERVSVLKPPNYLSNKLSSYLAFSPDGCLLACLYTQ